MDGLDGRPDLGHGQRPGAGIVALRAQHQKRRAVHYQRVASVFLHKMRKRGLARLGDQAAGQHHRGNGRDAGERGTDNFFDDNHTFGAKPFGFVFIAGESVHGFPAGLVKLIASSGSCTAPLTTGTRPVSFMPRWLSVTNTRISLTPAGSPETVAVRAAPLLTRCTTQFP